MPRFAWREVDYLSQQAQQDYAACLANPTPPTQQELLDRVVRNRDKSSRRARTKVRRLAKWKGLTVLLTLTYRENMQDRDRMARDLDVFIKRVHRVISGFEYVCVFERQKRGAWHAHLAVRRILSHYLQRGIMVRSYDLLRSMWRGVVGADNGNADVSRNKRISRSASKLASYLSKYIGKTFDQAAKYVNAYSSSAGDLPDAIKERVLGETQAGAIGALMSMIRPEISAAGQVSQLFIDGGGYFLCLCPPERGKPPIGDVLGP